jgi:HEPN domain-containing protein
MAGHNLEVAQDLFERQRFDWCLFVGHLVLEKVNGIDFDVKIVKLM